MGSRLQSSLLLWLATVITVSVVMASQAFTQRISLMLDNQASELLAADLLVTSSSPLPQSYSQLAHQYQLKTALSSNLRTAIFADDRLSLVELKAVTEKYPLRGDLQIKRELLSPAETVKHIPSQGEAWVDPKLSSFLGKTLELGDHRFQVTATISYEPDRGGSLFNLAPRVLINHEDLDSTGLIIPGSRAKYALLVAGSATAVEAFERDIKSLLTDQQGLQSLDNARPEMRNALERTRLFFSLAIILTLVIAMSAIAITARYMATRETTRVAVLRTFGLSNRRILMFYISELLKVWLWSLPFGLALGYLAQAPLEWALGEWFSTELPQTDFQPLVLSVLVGLIALIGFSLPPLWRVLQTSPMRVFREGVEPKTRQSTLLWGMFSLTSLIAVLWLVIGQIKLTLMLTLVIVMTVMIVPALLKLLVKFISLMQADRFWILNYLTSRLLTSNRNALYVMTGFSITLISVLMISQVKDQLLNDWQRQLPKDKPNYFFVNIPPEKTTSLQQHLQRSSVQTSQAYAMVRGRLRKINGKEVDQINFENDRAHRLVNHVFNISYTNELPVDNEITEGRWLTDSDTTGVSIELGMAESLGIKLGDSMEFSVGSEIFTSKVSSLRSVLWENFRPNFYVLGTQAQLGVLPQTWMMSARVNEDQQTVFQSVLQQYPSVTVLDISEVMKRIKNIIEHATTALEFFFLFALAAALLVLVSAVYTSAEDRRTEVALLAALGANKRHKVQSQILEWVLMGLLVGVFSALIASVAASAISIVFFELGAYLSITLWVSSLLASIILVSVIGYLFLFRSLDREPMRLLRS